MAQISMQFPAVLALDSVSFEIEPGEVHGVVGENGAGKSTLMKILSGLQAPTSGQILLDGKATQFSSIRDALAGGVAMIHQELNLVEELSVTENVFLGREEVKLGVLNRAAMRAKTLDYLKDVHASFDPDSKVSELSIAGKQLVEIAKALAINTEVLIMDEPTAVLSEPEAEALFELVAKLKQKGVTVLYISHRLSEVCRICDRITVLRDGQFVKTMPGPGSTPAELASLMVGRPLGDFFPPKPTVPDVKLPPVLQVKDAVVSGHVHGVSLTVRPGEILGLAGLVGAGRTELAEAIIGARSLMKGEILFAGQPVTIHNPKTAMDHGIVYVSEDRKGLGLILNMNVIENLTLANLKSYGTVPVDRRAESEATKKWVENFDIKAGDLEAPILYLSGGNQQKVSIAKWLETKPKVLILDEPTRGVDVGAKREMYEHIHRFAEDGLACIVISSEMPEIIGLCHRAIVMREGRMMGEVSGEELNEQSIMRLAAGVLEASA